MPGGRPPKPTALHILDGTYRRDRHGKRIDAPKPGEPQVAPDELSPEEQAQRQAELTKFFRQLYGLPYVISKAGRRQ